MLPGRNCTENDFQTLSQWGATLVRYQMTDGPKPASGESQEAYLARYRTWLGAAGRRTSLVADTVVGPPLADNPRFRDKSPE